MKQNEAGYLDRAFAYHAWATRALIDFCAALSVDQQRLAAPGTTGSIERTLTHLVSSEQFYLRDLTGSDPSRWIETRVVPIQELGRHALENEARWREYLSLGLDPDESFTTGWRGRDRRVVRWSSLVQALTHGTEHRTHVCTVLGANGIEPPDISVGAYEDAVSSAADKERLGS